MMEKQLRLWVDEAGKKAMNENQCLSGQVEARDIAAATLFLASDQRRMMKAQELVVDGVWT